MWWITKFLYTIQNITLLRYKKKPPMSDMLCVEIISFVVVEDHVQPVGSGYLPRPQCSEIVTHSSPYYGGFVIILIIISLFTQIHGIKNNFKIKHIN